jgi:hypothetical protein
MLSGDGALCVGNENPDMGVEETGSPVDGLEFNIREINFSHTL